MDYKRFFWIVVCLANAQNKEESSHTNDIIYDYPDLNVKWAVNGVPVILRGYEVSKAPGRHWASIGHPFFISNQEGSLYEMNSEEIFMRLQLLPYEQETALKDYVYEKQGTSDIAGEVAIHLIPLSSVQCRTSFLWKNSTTSMYGEASNKNQHELSIEIPCPEDSDCRRAFMARIKQESSLVWRCVFIAHGEDRYTNRLNISSQILQDVILETELFGDAEKVLVTRDQLNSLADEVRKKLQIDELLELEDVRFNENMVSHLMSICETTFEYIPLPMALKDLSQYGFTMNLRDIEPDVMYKHLKEKLNGLENDDQQAGTKIRSETSSSEKSTSQNTAFSAAASFPFLFDMEVAGGYAKFDSLNQNQESDSDQAMFANYRKARYNQLKQLKEGEFLNSIALQVTWLYKDSFFRDFKILYNKVVRKNATYRNEMSIFADPEFSNKNIQAFDYLETELAKRWSKLVSMKDANQQLQDQFRKIVKPFTTLSTKCQMITKFDQQASSILEVGCRDLGNDYFVRNVEYEVDENLTKFIRAVQCCQVEFIDAGLL